MADFGEYTPLDAVAVNSPDPYEFHNQLPVLWASTVRYIFKLKSRFNNGELGKGNYFLEWHLKKAELLIRFYLGPDQVSPEHNSIIPLCGPVIKMSTGQSQTDYLLLL